MLALYLRTILVLCGLSRRALRLARACGDAAMVQAFLFKIAPLIDRDSGLGTLSAITLRAVSDLETDKTDLLAFT